MDDWKWLGRCPGRFRSMTAHIPVFYPSTMPNHAEPYCLTQSQDSDSRGMQGALESFTFVTLKTFWYAVKVGKHHCEPGPVKNLGHRSTKMTRCYPRGILFWEQVIMQTSMSMQYDKHSEHLVLKVQSGSWLCVIFVLKNEGILSINMKQVLSNIMCNVLWFQITFSDLPLRETPLYHPSTDHREFKTGLKRPMYL